VSHSDALLEPMTDDKLACWENGFSCRSIPSDERVGGLPARQPRAAGVGVRPWAAVWGGAAPSWPISALRCWWARPRCGSSASSTARGSCRRRCRFALT